LPKRPNIREVLALNLISMRGERGWSQDALALEAGLHRTFIAHVERRSRNISLDSLERIAVAMDVPTHELLVPQEQVTEPS
jgi:transcriptional regulator with XRE-family HTH domain